MLDHGVVVEGHVAYLLLVFVSPALDCIEESQIVSNAFVLLAPAFLAKPQNFVEVVSNCGNLTVSCREGFGFVFESCQLLLYLHVAPE